LLTFEISVDILPRTYICLLDAFDQYPVATTSGSTNQCPLLNLFKVPDYTKKLLYNTVKFHRIP